MVLKITGEDEGVVDASLVKPQKNGPWFKSQDTRATHHYGESSVKVWSQIKGHIRGKLEKAQFYTSAYLVAVDQV